MSLTIEDLNQTLCEYRNQQQQCHTAVQHLTGAIAAIEHQINVFVKKQAEIDEQNKKEAEEDKLKTEEEQKNAAQEGNQPKDNSDEHQDGDCSGKESETSSGDCLQPSGQE